MRDHPDMTEAQRRRAAREIGRLTLAIDEAHIRRAQLIDQLLVSETASTSPDGPRPNTKPIELSSRRRAS